MNDCVANSSVETFLSLVSAYKPDTAVGLRDWKVEFQKVYGGLQAQKGSGKKGSKSAKKGAKAG